MDPESAVVQGQPATQHSLTTRLAWERAREACLADPGAYHGDIAASAIHWCVRGSDGRELWITRDDRGQWHGIDAHSAEPVVLARDAADLPWAQSFDAADAPHFRWFSGGLTNACFNEVDRHVAMGHGDEVAFFVEGDRWDQSQHGGRGGPVVSRAVTRKELLLEVAIAAIVLERLGVRPGDRIALNLPNIFEQAVYTEAAKRLGVLYTPIFGGFSDKTLSDRLHDAGARVVVTSDGAYRNAQVVPFKEAYTDAALDRFLAVEVASIIVARTLDDLSLPPATASRLTSGVRSALAGEITVERSDVMAALGRAIAGAATEGMAVSAAQAATIRTAVARALVASPPRVDAVIVVRHTGQSDVGWRTERDHWHHELAAAAEAELLAAIREAGTAVADRSALSALPDREFVRAIWSRTRPRAVDAEYPLFVIYTSGSTGKPKGVVHVHGGYVAGVAHTMRVAFDAAPGDVMYVVADPGWITGQSYMYSAALTTRVTSVLTEGSPVFPSAARFASIIERYGVQIFKAGVTFLKGIMQDAQHAADVRRYALDTLRVATFCAEPTSPAVQQFAMELVCPWYINSYWATEHGGIVFTQLFGNPDFPLRADAHTRPLPWVAGDVWQASGTSDADGRVAWRRAEDGEKGELVITAPYPYLARTIWGDAGHCTVDESGTRINPAWRGDAARYAATYWSRWAGAQAYTQGDFAVRHADGSVSLHGRSDDVINVSGHRLGTEEIEGAILRDKTLSPDSVVGNVIVVGAPHPEKGLTPLAFIVPTAGRRIMADDRRRLIDLVRSEKGALAVPDDFLEVPGFPETRSGKYMRRMVRAIVEGEPVGDVTTLRNPEVLDAVRTVVHEWRQRQAIADQQRVLDYYRYFRVQYHPVDLRDPQAGLLALLTVANPPVNALNERALDELVTIVEHLNRRDDVQGVICTGAGATTFVAGADIRQLLDEVDTLEAALPLPNNAHLAFRRIETSRKPWIAAINGAALGGGLEFALACHVRIAESTAIFGQPEIRLNLLPGYGGTQRLPRLLWARTGIDGFRAACEMVGGGRTVDVETARAIGLIDEVVDSSDDVVTRASLLLRQVLRGDDQSRTVQDARLMRERWLAPGDPAALAVFDGAMWADLTAQAGRVGRTIPLRRVREAIEMGWRRGLDAGLEHEARQFAEAVVDTSPAGGKAGIRAFFDRRSAPLPVRSQTRPEGDQLSTLLAAGALLPIGAPFYPGLTPLPTMQFAQAVLRDPATGAPAHGEPRQAEREVVVPVPVPGPNEALVYVLASEVNFNDIWAITGIPVSPFDNHDLDEQVTGSGGVGLVAALGSALKAEGRLRIGDLAAIYSGQSDLLSPFAARDPMSADFAIQGYETDTGSHQQFLVVQGPQLHTLPSSVTLEEAGGYILNLGTVVRALFTTLGITMDGADAGHQRTLFVEGAATGTGLDALKSAVRQGVAVTGLVSSDARATAIREQGAVGAINRSDPLLASCFVPVPEGDASVIAEWERAGAPLLAAFRAQHEGRLADYVLSHAGERSFPRGVQLLAPGGTLAFYGASSGYHFTFAGKEGAVDTATILRRARLHAGEAVLLFYGVDGGEGALEDPVGLEAIEAVRARRGRLVVATCTDAQRAFVSSLGFGDAVRGVLSIEELLRRHGDDFVWPTAMPPLPDVRADAARFRDGVRAFQERTLKPFGSAVGALLRSADNPRGAPDLVIERAGHDALAVSTSLIKPFTGRVCYAESMHGRRYSFYAPQVWTRQRRIYCPTFQLFGTHLCNAFEVTRMNDMIDAGLLDVTPPTVVPWSALPEAHQAMWENRHAGATYVVNHALPRLGLRSRDELFEAWAAGDNA